MERRMLELGGRSCGDGMEGAVWKEWIEFGAKIRIFSDTAKIGGGDKEMFELCFQIESS